MLCCSVQMLCCCLSYAVLPCTCCVAALTLLGVVRLACCVCMIIAIRRHVGPLCMCWHCPSAHLSVYDGLWVLYSSCSVGALNGSSVVPVDHVANSFDCIQVHSRCFLCQLGSCAVKSADSTVNRTVGGVHHHTPQDRPNHHNHCGPDYGAGK